MCCIPRRCYEEDEQQGGDLAIVDVDEGAKGRWVVPTSVYMPAAIV